MRGAAHRDGVDHVGLKGEAVTVSKGRDVELAAALRGVRGRARSGLLEESDVVVVGANGRRGPVVGHEVRAAREMCACAGRSVRFDSDESDCE